MHSNSLSRIGIAAFLVSFLWCCLTMPCFGQTNSYEGQSVTIIETEAIVAVDGREIGKAAFLDEFVVKKAQAEWLWSPIHNGYVKRSAVVRSKDLIAWFKSLIEEHRRTGNVKGQAAAHILRGIAYNRVEDHNSAILDFRESIRINPTSLAHYYLYRNAKRMGLVAEALEAINKAVQLSPDDVDYRVARANTVIEQKIAGYEKIATEDLLEAQRIQPNDPRIYRSRAELYTRDPKKSLPEFEAAIRVAPNDPINYSDRAIEFLRLSDIPSMLKDSRKVLELNPNESRSHYYLAKFDDALGLEQKIEHLDRCIELEPSYALAHEFKISLLRDSKQPEATLQACNDWCKRSKDSERALRQRAEVFAERKDYAMAIRDWEAILERDPGSDATKKIASLLQESEGIDASIAYLEDRIKKSPKNPRLHVVLGDMLGKQGKIDQALNSFDVAIALDPNSNGVERKYALLEQAQRWEELRRELDRLIAAAPASSNGYRLRGDYWTNRGELENAIRDYTIGISVESHPYHAPLYVARRNAWRKQENWDEILQELDKAIAESPETIVFRMERGRFWEAKGEWEKALADYDEAQKIDLRYETSKNGEEIPVYDRYHFPRHDRNRMLTKLGAWDRLISDADDHIRRRSGKAMPFLERAELWIAQEKWDKAMLDCEIALNFEFLPQGLELLAKCCRHNGKWDRLRASYAELLVRHPKDAKFLQSYAHFCEETEDADMAMELITRLLKIDPKNSYRIQRREHYSRILDEAKALALLDGEVEASPQEALPLEERAEFFLARKQYERAVAEYQAAFRLAPKNIDLLIKIGNAYRNWKDHVMAASYYDRALAMDGKNSWALLCRGLNRIDQDDKVGAEEDLNAAIEISPTYESAKKARRNLWASQGQQERGLAELTAALEADPTNPVRLFQFGSYLFERREWTEGIARYSQAIELRSQYKEAWNDRGVMRKNLGDFESALTDFDRAIEIDPTFHLARRNRIDALKALKRWAQVVEELEAKAIKTNKASDWNQLSWTLATCEDESVLNGAKAVETARKACEKSSWKQPIYIDTLAAALARAGQFEEACTMQRKAMDMLSDSEKLADYQARLQRYEQREAVVVPLES